MNVGDTVMLDYGDGGTGYTAVIVELGIIPSEDVRDCFIHSKDVGQPGALVNWHDWTTQTISEPTDLSWVQLAYLRIN